MVHLLPDFRARGAFVRQRIGRIAELVDEERAGLLRDALGHVLVVLGVTLAHIGAGEHDLRAHRLQVEDFFPAHFIGHDQDQLVSL